MRKYSHPEEGHKGQQRRSVLGDVLRRSWIKISPRRRSNLESDATAIRSPAARTSTAARSHRGGATSRDGSSIGRNAATTGDAGDGRAGGSREPEAEVPETVAQVEPRAGGGGAGDGRVGGSAQSGAEASRRRWRQRRDLAAGGGDSHDRAVGGGGAPAPAPLSLSPTICLSVFYLSSYKTENLGFK
jgi:hypothetical protein